MVIMILQVIIDNTKPNNFSDIRMMRQVWLILSTDFASKNPIEIRNHRVVQNPKNPIKIFLFLFSLTILCYNPMLQCVEFLICVRSIHRWHSFFVRNLNFVFQQCHENVIENNRWSLSVKTNYPVLFCYHFLMDWERV